MGPIRTCLACRRARPARELVRLVVLDGVQIDLERRLPGRGVWVCPHRACVSRLERRGEQVGRAARRPAPELRGLGALVRAAVLGSAREALVAAHRSGGVVSGAGALDEISGQPVVALVHASDAGVEAVAAARALAPQALMGSIGLDRVALGQLIGRGPRAVLAVRAGKLGIRFAHQLQCSLDLG